MANQAPDQTPAEFRYSCYTLVVLTIVYIVNFVDRQILAILNEEIKRDLHLSDAQMGFLYGTVFAIFYALFGIPFGRLADTWIRRTLVAYAVAFWSAATVVSGFARNFLELGLARVAVGVGEAGTGPCAYSLLADSFRPARRATVIAILTSGVYIGAGFGIFIGGQVVQRWNDAFAPGTAPFDLAGWQVAFFVIGFPGLLLALWVRTLREPVRGAMDGVLSPTEPHPFRDFGAELCAVLPGLTLVNLKRLGATRRVVALNLIVLVGLGAVAWVMIATVENTAQWIALAVGFYATFSWGQSLFLRDPPTAVLILKSRAWVLFVLGVSLFSFSMYGMAYFTAPFFIRYHDVLLGELGFTLGGITAAAGFLGVTMTGVLADFWRAHDPRGRLFTVIVFALLPIPFGLWMLFTPSTTLAFWLNGVVVFCGAAWLGVGGSTVTDLVLPRMRGRATAVYILTVTLLGLAFGPFTVGLVSDLTGELRTGLMAALSGNVGAAVLVAAAAAYLVDDERTLFERAKAAGEAGLTATD
ncbi:MAG: spinster family MFS transporter [Gammaproteobacteria bacterium]